MQPHRVLLCEGKGKTRLEEPVALTRAVLETHGIWGGHKANSEVTREEEQGWSLSLCSAEQLRRASGPAGDGHKQWRVTTVLRS